jgi:hypothetical protein
VRGMTSPAAHATRLDVVDDVPDAFTHKMKLMKDCLNLPGDTMFTPKVQRFAKYPCSLVFGDVGRMPISAAAVDVLDMLSEALGPFGAREGFYGAGGGPIHLFYFGKYNDGDAFPPLLELLKTVMKIDSKLEPPFPWRSNVDATHQHLFPRTFKEMEGGKYNFLQVVYAALNSNPNVAVFPYAFPEICQQEFSSFMEEPRILFVEPHYRMMHDGGCPEGCPRDASVLVEAIGGSPGNPGDVYESPSFAFIYLKSGEIMALCNWDYRD